MRGLAAARRATSVGTTGSRDQGPRVTALSRISGRSTDGSTVSSHATASATSDDPDRVHLERNVLQHLGFHGSRRHDVDAMPSRSTSSAKARANAFMPAFDAE